MRPFAGRSVAVQAVVLVACSLAWAPSRPVYIRLSLDPSRVTGGKPASGTVSLRSPAPSGGIEVALSADRPAAAVPARVTVPAGQSSASFRIGTVPVPANVSVTITASAGAPTRAFLSVSRPRLLSITIPPVLHGNEPFTGTVTLNGEAPGPNYPVILRPQAPGGYLSYPASVPVPAGATHAEFTGHVGSVPSPRSGQIVGEAGGTVLPVSTRLLP